MDWKEGVKLGKDEREADLGPGRQQLLRGPSRASPEMSPLLPISLRRQTFPDLEPWETASRDPAWVAWALPTIAGEHGPFVDGSRVLGHARTLQR